MPRTNESHAHGADAKGEHVPPLEVLPFVEIATRGHCAESFPGEDHARWLASLERRASDPAIDDPTRKSIPPELSIPEDIVGPDLE
jgi:hypothetical protein